MDVRERCLILDVLAEIGHSGPGSILEVRKVLPLLVEAPDGQPSFHVVAFSLPGFGFSEAPKKKGFDAAKFAEVSAMKCPTSYVLTIL